MSTLTSTVQPPSLPALTRWRKVSRAPSSFETSTNSRSGTSVSTTNSTFGPPFGLRTPVEPAAKGPSRRTHSVSVFHCGQVSMSAQRAKNAAGGAEELACAVVMFVMGVDHARI